MKTQFDTMVEKQKEIETLKDWNIETMELLNKYLQDNDNPEIRMIKKRIEQALDYYQEELINTIPF